MNYTILLLGAIFGSVIAFSIPNKERIVGGDNVDEKARPFQLSIRKHNKHICGGAILSKSFGLTAASCYFLRGKKIESTKEYTAVAGIVKTSDVANQQINQIVKFVVYPGYDSERHVGDLAIVILEKQFELNDFVQTISFPKYGNEINDGSSVTVSGWGVTSDGSDKPSEILQNAVLKVVDNKKCDRIYEGSIIDSHICAFESGKGFCYKDQGNPLILENQLIGIASWFVGCGSNKFPGVFTRVDRFDDWINTVIAN